MLNDQNIARLLDIANTASHVGDANNAKLLCKAILEVKPNFAPAEISLAYNYLSVDEFEKSMQVLDDVLKKNPQDEEALFLLSFQCFLMGDSSKAREVAKPLENAKNEAVRNFAKEIMSAPDFV